MTNTQQFGGMVYPANEQHMIEWLRQDNPAPWNGRLIYQERKQRRVLQVCRSVGRTRLAVDVGAHVGTWAVNLVGAFEAVLCYEPIPVHRICLQANLANTLDGTRAQIRKTGCGGAAGWAQPVFLAGNTGGTSLTAWATEAPVPDDAVRLVRLDDEPGTDWLDLLKVDTEGHELDVLQGATGLIAQWQPIVLIEQKFPRDDDKRRTAAMRWLQKGHGYRLLEDLGGGDMLMMPPLQR